MPKITIVGAGYVGSTIAHILSMKNLSDVILMDIVEGFPQGKALDISQAAPIFNLEHKVTGTNNYADTADSDIVVITAGIPRKPGMTREDLIETNKKIVQDVTQNVVQHSPNSVIIVVSNPLDIMVSVAYKASGFPKSRVIGMSGVLDSSRFAYFISEELNTPLHNINALVIGCHGEKMIPLPRLSTINSTPLSELLPAEKVEALAERTRKAGLEIITLLKTLSTAYAPASAVCRMAEAILNDSKEILPCSVLLEGEYNTEGVFICVPVKLGKDGVEEIIQLDLNEQEMKEFKDAAEYIRSLN